MSDSIINPEWLALENKPHGILIIDPQLNPYDIISTNPPPVITPSTHKSTCPHCGARPDFHTPEVFLCGTSFTFNDLYGGSGPQRLVQTTLCQERVAHNATRKQLTEMTAIAEELEEKLISLMYKLPRVDCQCEFCVLLRRFEEIKEGIQ